MSAAKRQHAGAAVEGLFERPSATGGLAGRDHQHEPQRALRASRGPSSSARGAGDESLAVASDARVRLGVELSERETAFLRALSRPARTGGPRTLGTKFVGTGILAAAIELLAETGIDMHGVAAGDLQEMTARARAALLRAATPDVQEEAHDEPPQ